MKHANQYEIDKNQKRLFFKVLQETAGDLMLED